MLDEAGMPRTVKVPALYIQDDKVKLLLSVNSLGDVYPEETVTFHPQGATMSGVPGYPNQGKFTSQDLYKQPSTSYTYEYQGPTKHPITWPTLSQPLMLEAPKSLFCCAL